MNLKAQQLTQDFVQLARTALTGRPQDIQLLIHRASKKYSSDYSEMSKALLKLLKESPSRSSPLRKQTETPLPVDIDTRLKLLKVDITPPETEPILSQGNLEFFKQIQSERHNVDSLYKNGLRPTKSLLFTGPPGVGKTLSAKWLATILNRPLLTLDLAAVMSSYLGRTGNNIRFVLDYAKNIDCILLIDELDAIAKRRDDNSEVGELKRLVTVLLQEIDDWPSSGMLIAATNHPKLLDPAIWRRFEAIIEFSYPAREQIQDQVTGLINGYIKESELWSKILSYAFSGYSFSDVERKILQARKYAAINNTSLEESLKSLINSNGNLTHDERIELACALNESGVVSQRAAHEITGVARDTIRKYIVENKSERKFSKNV